MASDCLRLVLNAFSMFLFLLDIWFNSKSFNSVFLYCFFVIFVIFIKLLNAFFIIGFSVLAYCLKVLKSPALNALAITVFISPISIKFAKFSLDGFIPAEIKLIVKKALPVVFNPELITFELI